MRNSKISLLVFLMVGITIKVYSQPDKPFVIQGKIPEAKTKSPNDGSNRGNGPTSEPTGRTPAQKVLTFDEKVDLEFKRRMDNLTPDEKLSLTAYGREKFERKIREQAFLEISEREHKEKLARERAEKEEKDRQEKAKIEAKAKEDRNADRGSGRNN